VKDFYDFHQIIVSRNLNGRLFIEVLRKVLLNRNRVIDSSNINVFDNLLGNSRFIQNLERYFNQIDVAPINSSLLIELIKKFTIPVYEALLSNSEFNSHWNKDDLVWHNF
jgi:hypothetical protein